MSNQEQIGSDLRRRVLADIGKVPASTRLAVSRRRRFSIAAAAITTVAATLVMGPELGTRSVVLAVLGLGAAISVLVVGMYHEGRVWEKPSVVWLASLAPALLILAGWSGGAQETASWGRHATCGAMSAALAAVPVWMLAFASRRSEAVAPLRRAWLLALTGAVLGAIPVLMHCPHHGLLHVTLGHAAAASMAAALFVPLLARWVRV